jgi:hypothetical protein
MDNGGKARREERKDKETDVEYLQELTSSYKS